MPDQAQSLSRQFRERLISIEKREGGLYFFLLILVIALDVGFVLLLFPAIFLRQSTIHIRAEFSPQLLLGLQLLLLLFIVHILQEHIKTRRLRLDSIMESWHFQISHAHLLIDPLTRAYSRAALEEILSREIKRVERQQSTLVFFYIDIDDFKGVNTRFGHLSGDLVLSEVGALLKHSVRGSDYVIRLGGDEFLIALADTNTAGADPVRRRIQEKLAEWNQHSLLPGFRLSLSIGVKEFDGRQSLDEVLAEADSKMYAEKEKSSSDRDMALSGRIPPGGS